jgi:hypothetical protein
MGEGVSSARSHSEVWIALRPSLTILLRMLFLVQQNDFLDRALVIPTVQDSGAALFAAL